MLSCHLSCILVIKELKLPQVKILTSHTEALLSHTGIYMLHESSDFFETIEDEISKLTFCQEPNFLLKHSRDRAPSRVSFIVLCQTGKSYFENF